MLFLGIVIVLLCVALYFLNKAAPAPSTESLTEGTQRSISIEGQPTQGNSDAKVKIVEFGDFKCPACRSFESDIYPQVKEKYIDTGKASLSFVNFSFLSETFRLPDNDSRRAAMYGEAVYHQNKDAFWTFYDLLYKNQGDESQVWATKEFLNNIVKQIPGLDADKIEKEVENNTYQKEFDLDNSIVRQTGVDVAPSIFVNGRFVESPTFENLSKIIEEELAK